MSILEKISSLDDLKKLNYDQLNTLSDEIRKLMIDTVSKTGGHLSSNLGVVELSIALHKMFNSPEDKIIWDVSHQVYTHKILTGRYKDFSKLRQEGGISGFSSPAESEHDIFYTGHSSTSISQALGIATANSLCGKSNYTIAVIGDGALTGGLAYEALNNAAHSGKGLIVILNDNKMSISENVGSMARYLAAIRTKPEYFKLKAQTESAINKIPVIGTKTSKVIFDIKTTVKNKMYKSTFFEDLGFRYMGPIDGHNIEQLCEALEAAKLIDVPVLLHINTVKGKGYNFAEMSPSEFHGISKFNVYNGESQTGSDSFSGVFGSKICELAEK
nr:1-deoxy-D-xylulose-5-phosphate synthase [Clostridiales bacterium]